MTDQEVLKRARQYEVLKDFLAYKKVPLEEGEYLIDWQKYLGKGWQRLTFEDFLRIIQGEIKPLYKSRTKIIGGRNVK